MPGELLTPLARHYLDPVARAKLAAVAVPRGPERWEISTRATKGCAATECFDGPHIPIYCHRVVVLSTASPGQPRDSHS